MARPKKFDETEVLNTITLLFWQRGYTATSMKDIENATQMTASSLYNHFGNKEALFTTVLNFYFENVIQIRIHTYLNRSGNPLKNLTDFFLSSVDKNVPKELQGHACLLVNTIAEWGPELSDLTGNLQKFDGVLKVALQKNIQSAQSQGLIRTDKSVDELTNYLKISMHGLLVESKLNFSPPHLQTIVTTIFDHITTTH